MIPVVEKTPAEEKDDISKLVSGMVKHSIGRQMSYKTMGVNEVMFSHIIAMCRLIIHQPHKLREYAVLQHCKSCFESSSG